MVSDEDFAKRGERWSFDVPDTKEAYLFRDIFDGKHYHVQLLRFQIQGSFKIGLFPTETAARTAVRWIPRGDWGCDADPSGRSVKIHNAAYEAD